MIFFFLSLKWRVNLCEERLDLSLHGVWGREGLGIKRLPRLQVGCWPPLVLEEAARYRGRTHSLRLILTLPLISSLHLSKSLHLDFLALKMGTGNICFPVWGFESVDVEFLAHCRSSVLVILPWGKNKVLRRKTKFGTTEETVMFFCLYKLSYPGKQGHKF